MKNVYEKPGIRQLDPANPYSNGHPFTGPPQVTTHIDKVKVDQLTARFGSPLFVFSEKRIREKFKKTSSAFNPYYPNIRFGWSYKTNYLSAVCAVFHQEGALAEVVSQMEYDKAQSLGLSGKDIIFNGPAKTKKALEKAVLQGAKIHIDHFDEMQILESIARTMNRKIKVGLRINLDTGITPQWSRFGFNLESGQAMAAARRMMQSSLLDLNGVHTHIGTYILAPDAYGLAIKKLLQFYAGLDSKSGWSLDYLDIGGGFPSKARLKGTYYSPEISVLPLDSYARAIGKAMAVFSGKKKKPELILESGRAMIDDAGFLLTKIMAHKRLPDGRRSYVADAGINLLYTSNWYRHKIALGRQTPGMCESCVIYGPLCMNIDVIEETVMLPPLKAGDLLVVSPVGAYNVTQWMQFITYRPAVVMIDEKGGVDLIREKEDLTDIARREILPDRLKTKALRKRKLPAA